MSIRSYLSIIISLTLVSISYSEDFFAMAQDRSKLRKKPVLYIIKADWSGTYKKMLDEVLTHPLVYEYMAHFDLVELDGDNPEVKKSLPAAFQARTYPAIAIYSPLRLLGTKVGYINGRELFDFLHYSYRRFRYDYYQVNQEWLPNPMIAPWDEESRSRDQLSMQNGYLLRTGRVITGTPMRLHKGFVVFSESGLEHKIQAALFTPKARSLAVKKALETMELKSSLIPGPETEGFLPLSGLSEINARKASLKKPFLVLLDPKDEFSLAISLHSSNNLKDKNSLTYIKKFRIGSNIDKVGLDKIANFYKVELPALLILNPGLPVQKISKLKSVTEFFTPWQGFVDQKLSKKE